jgi:ribosome-associated translation inhibitor RaiA
MQILVNSDHNIHSDEALSERVESIVIDSTGRFADRITRVEVHLKDANGAKHGADDKRCTMEARVGGLAPIVVTHDASSLREAIDGAADKLERALEHAYGRLADKAGPAPREEEIATPELIDKARHH